MTDKPKRLTDTARTLLTAAAGRGDHLIQPPHLPIAAARQVARSLLGSGFAQEAPTSDEAADLGWPVGDGARSLLLRATTSGLARIADGADTKDSSVANEAMAEAEMPLTEVGSDASIAAAAPGPSSGPSPSHSYRPARDVQVGPDVPNERQKAVSTTADAAEPATRFARRAARGDGLQAAAQALLDAWDNQGDKRGEGLEELVVAIADFRSTLAAGAPQSRPIDRTSPRLETKRAQVLAMLGRNEGASGPQIAEATGWAAHTVRGFLAGLARKSIPVEVLDRVRQVGSNKQGAKGSFTIYRIPRAVRE
jgi:hypothetical protein